MLTTVVIVYWSLYWNLVWPVQRYQGLAGLSGCYFMESGRCLSATPLASHHCSQGSKYTNFLRWYLRSETITVIIKKKTKQNKTKKGIIYLYTTNTSYLAHTQKIEEIVTLNTLMKPIFNWGRLASEIVMAARGVIVTWLSGVTTVLGHGLTHWGRVTRDAYIRQ